MRNVLFVAVYTKEYLTSVAKSVGVAIGKLHDAEIVHGDLTTSNMIAKQESSGELGTGVVLIDFGLGMMKPTQEDKAVDLYVLERAFISTHPGSEYLVRETSLLPKMLLTCCWKAVCVYSCCGS
jgi:Kae1-associated kinase Bud32